MNILSTCVTGSRLYGLEHDNSDRDYLSVYLPKLENILLGDFEGLIDLSTSTNSRKNTKDDIDHKIYSLSYFVQAACSGNKQLLDMLHAQDLALSVTSPIWKSLMALRRRFYHKSMNNSIDVIRLQILQYGHRRETSESLRKLMRCCGELDCNMRIRDLVNDLPVTDHIYFVVSDGDKYRLAEKSELKGNRGWFYRVNGALLECTLKIKQVATLVAKKLGDDDAYFEKVLIESEGKSVDWKEVMHALRNGYQMLHILKDGDYNYPLPESDFLRAVRGGFLDFKGDVMPLAKALVADIEKWLLVSTLPDVIDHEFWKNWLLNVYIEEYEISLLASKINS